MGKNDLAEAVISIIIGYMLYEFVEYLHVLGGGTANDFLTSYGYFSIYALSFWLLCFVTLTMVWQSNQFFTSFFRRTILSFVLVSFCNYYYNQAEDRYWKSYKKVITMQKLFVTHGIRIEVMKLMISVSKTN